MSSALKTLASRWPASALSLASLSASSSATSSLAAQAPPSASSCCALLSCSSPHACGPFPPLRPRATVRLYHGLAADGSRMMFRPRASVAEKQPSHPTRPVVRCFAGASPRLAATSPPPPPTKTTAPGTSPRPASTTAAAPLPPHSSSADATRPVATPSFPSPPSTRPSLSSAPPPAPGSSSSPAAHCAVNNSRSSSCDQPALDWEAFFKLRLRRRRIQLVFSVVTGLVSCFTGAAILSAGVADPLVAQVPLDPIFTLGILTLTCGCMGWLLGPSIGSQVFYLINGKLKTQMMRKENEFFARIKKHRVDPANSSAGNPVPDFYGEKIQSLSGYKQWLKDQEAFNKKKSANFV